MKLFVDASRNRSGGAIEYLIGVFNSNSIKSFNGEIHIYAPKKVLSQLPDNSKALVKRSSWMIENNLMWQLLWQLIVAPFILYREKFDMLFSTDASTVTFFRRHVVMSQDMLSYEDGIIDLYPLGIRKVRLWIIYYLQNFAFKRARGIIFLTHYASNKIQEHCGKVNNFTVIPHGIHGQIRVPLIPEMKNIEQGINIVFVSNVAPYKNQWIVIEAIDLVRSKGYNVRLTLVGGGEGPAQQLTKETMNKIDPSGEFIKQFGYLRRKEVQAIVSKSDIYVFASSCENLPVTLLEGMSFGLPIVSSNRGPMPEVLQGGGLYFDPDDASTLATVIISTIVNDADRIARQEESFRLSKNYSWQRTAKDTLKYLMNLN